MGAVLPEGYKDSPVGAIPNDWDAYPLKTVADINPAKSKLDESDQVTFLGMADLSESGHVIGGEIKEYSTVSSGFTSFVDDDVLVAKITPCFENGKGAHVSELTNGVGFGSTEFHVLRAKPLVAPGYLYRVIYTEEFRTQGERNMVGSAGQRRVPTDFIKNYIVALPPLPEQKKIARILSTVDSKLALIDQQITATQTLKKGLMQKLFSEGVGTQDADGKWQPHTEFKDSELGRIPVGWEVKSIRQALQMVERPVDMSDHCEYQLVTVKRRYGGVVERSKLLGKDIKVKSQYYLKAGDFLISKRQIVHGACGIVPNDLEGAIVSNEYHSFRAKPDFDLEYISRLVQTPHYLNSFLLSSIGVHIEKMLFKYEQWAKFEIPVPPIDEQQRISKVFSTVDRKLERLTTQKTQTEHLKKGLMQKLLTGQIRVKPDSQDHIQE